MPAGPRRPDEPLHEEHIRLRKGLTFGNRTWAAMDYAERGLYVQLEVYALAERREFLAPSDTIEALERLFGGAPRGRPSETRRIFERMRRRDDPLVGVLDTPEGQRIRMIGIRYWHGAIRGWRDERAEFALWREQHPGPRNSDRVDWSGGAEDAAPRVDGPDPSKPIPMPRPPRAPARPEPAPERPQPAPARRQGALEDDASAGPVSRSPGDVDVDVEGEEEARRTALTSGNGVPAHAGQSNGTAEATPHGEAHDGADDEAGLALVLGLTADWPSPGRDEGMERLRAIARGSVVDAYAQAHALERARAAGRVRVPWARVGKAEYSPGDDDWQAARGVMQGPPGQGGMAGIGDIVGATGPSRQYSAPQVNRCRPKNAQTARGPPVT